MENIKKVLLLYAFEIMYGEYENINIKIVNSNVHFVSHGREVICILEIVDSMVLRQKVLTIYKHISLSNWE